MMSNIKGKPHKTIEDMLIQRLAALNRTVGLKTVTLLTSLGKISSD